MNKEMYSPSYGCTVFDDRHEDDDRKVIDYEMMSSICKSIKANQMKFLHKRIIDIADELYRFSDELDMSDKEERNCKISIIEALKELNNVTEYLTKRTLVN
jgi:tryptophanase